MKKILAISTLALFGLMTTSCSKLTEGYDSDVNNPNNAPPEFMIDGAMAADVLVQEGELVRATGMWIGQFVGTDRQYVSLSNYNTTSGDWDNVWGSAYSSCLAQCRIIQDKCDASNNPGLKGVAQVIEAHVAGTLTALWGDVPFTQAANVEVYPEPAYDPQAEVYAHIQELLDSAIVNLAAGGITNEYGNLMTLDDWTNVAHSLKARYYLHVRDYANAIAHANMGITSDWTANHNGNGLGGLNLMAQFIDYYRSGYIGAEGCHLSNLLTARGETARHDYYYTSGGYTALDPNFVDGIFQETNSYMLFDTKELNLIKAECYLRTADLANALAAHNMVRAELDAEFGGYPAFTGPEFFPGGALYDGVSTESSALMEMLKERYITLYGQLEAFNDVRRTDNYIGITPNNGGPSLPGRMLYPQSEINSNNSIPNPLPGLFDETPINQ